MRKIVYSFYILYFIFLLIVIFTDKSFNYSEKFISKYYSTFIEKRKNVLKKELTKLNYSIDNKKIVLNRYLYFSDINRINLPKEFKLYLNEQLINKKNSNLEFIFFYNNREYYIYKNKILILDYKKILVDYSNNYIKVYFSKNPKLCDNFKKYYYVNVLKDKLGNFYFIYSKIQFYNNIVLFNNLIKALLIFINLIIVYYYIFFLKKDLKKVKENKKLSD